jgi:hypothetical protein
MSSCGLHPGIGGGREASVGDVGNKPHLESLGESSFVPATKDSVAAVPSIDSLFGTNQNVDSFGLQLEGNLEHPRGKVCRPFFT